jgi:hypothetical protein
LNLGWQQICTGWRRSLWWAQRHTPAHCDATATTTALWHFACHRCAHLQYEDLQMLPRSLQVEGAYLHSLDPVCMFVCVCVYHKKTRFEWQRLRKNKDWNFLPLTQYSTVLDVKKTEKAKAKDDNKVKKKTDVEKVYQNDRKDIYIYR